MVNSKGYAAIAIGSNLNAFFSSFTGLSNILPISFMAFTKTTNWFAPSPLPTTTLPFKNSDVGLLLGVAVLGFCPDFGVDVINAIVFSL